MAARRGVSLLETVKGHNPYQEQINGAMDALARISAGIDTLVQRERQRDARREIIDTTYVSFDDDPSLFFPAVTNRPFGAIQVPENMGWRITRIAIAATPEAVTGFLLYRGAPQPQNLVERISTLADGTIVSGINNKLYLAPGTLLIARATVENAHFHINLEIERLVPYMNGVSSSDLQGELVQTPGPLDGPDSESELHVDTVEATAVTRHSNPITEDPADQPVANQQDSGAHNQLLPDVSAHFPPAHP